MFDTTVARLLKRFTGFLMGLSVIAPAGPADSAKPPSPPQNLTIPERVALIREHLSREQARPETADTLGSAEISPQPGGVTQWYNWPNWPNWGNWNNWRDWGNWWNNWRNW